MFSTMTGVPSLWRASNSSVSAALPCSSRGTSVDGFLRRDGVAGQLQEFAQEVEAGLLDVGVLLAQCVQAVAEFDEHRVVEVTGDPSGDLLLDLLRRDVLALALIRSSMVWASSTIVSRSALRHLDLDVLVDEVEGLGAERMPDEPAGDVGGADGLVDVGQPPVVGLVLAPASGPG